MLTHYPGFRYASSGLPAGSWPWTASVRGTAHFNNTPYKPHVTLQRNAQWNGSPLPPMPPLVWRAFDFVLLWSHRDEQSARYEFLARFPLSERER